MNESEATVRCTSIATNEKSPDSRLGVGTFRMLGAVTAQ